MEEEYPLDSFVWIDRLENVLKLKLHHFKKYTFRPWFLCFCW